MTQDLRELRLVDEPGLDEQRPEPASIRALTIEDLLQGLFGDELGVDEQLSETQARCNHEGRRVSQVKARWMAPTR